MEIISSKY